MKVARYEINTHLLCFYTPALNNEEDQKKNLIYNITQRIMQIEKFNKK